MTDVKCTRCGAKATGNSFEDASIKLDHAIGKYIGIPCGDNYNCVVEVKDKKEKPKEVTKPAEKPKIETPVEKKVEKPTTSKPEPSKPTKSKFN